MKHDRRRLAPALYLAALILLMAFGAWYVINRRVDVYGWVGLGLAGAALAAAILLDPGRARRALTGRQARHGSNTLLISLGVLGIIVLVNVLASANPARADLTEDQQYTLAPETTLTLAALPGQATIQGFYTSDLESSRENIRPLLEQYQLESDGRLSYEFIDPVENPLLARQLGVEQDGSLVVGVGDRSEVISYPTEEEITGALVRLSNPDPRNVYLLTGHGEADAEGGGENGYSQIRDALVGKNYTVNTLNLLADPTVPAEAMAVIVAGPTFGLSQAEVDALRAYVDGGGSLVLLLQPTAETEAGQPGDPLLNYLEESWGIRVQDDLVIEPRSSSFLVAVSFGYGEHAITARMQNLATLFPGARSLTLGGVEGVTQTSMVTTSDISWGETDLGFLQTQALPEFDEAADVAGPLTLAATAENSATSARLVVFGDSDFGTNSWLTQLGNRDVLLNSIDWAAEQESLIDLSPRPTTQRLVVPPSVQVQGLILLVSVVLVPGSVIVAGILVWLRRRKQA